MNKMLIILAGIGGASLLMATVAVLWIMVIYNTEIGLRTRFEAQQKEVETSLDTMAKTLQNKYQISREFADDFLKVVTAHTQGRLGGSVFKANMEGAPPTFTPELAMEMANTISGETARFKRSQDTLVDIWREHKRFCLTIPNRFFVSGMILPEPKMIVATSTREAVDTKILENNLLPIR